MKLLYTCLMGLLCLGIQAQSNYKDFIIHADRTYINEKPVNLNVSIEKQGDVLIWTQESSGHATTLNFKITGTKGNWNYNLNKGDLLFVLNGDQGVSGSIQIKSGNDSLSSEMLIKTDSNELHTFLLLFHKINFSQR